MLDLKLYRVYLAGPDVFRKNAESHFDAIKDFMSFCGLKGISPIDVEVVNHEDIYDNNLDLIKSCQWVLANLDPFRGVSLDVGTAMEIGYAKALNKTIVGYYTNGYPKIYKDRIKRRNRDNTYVKHEDFNLYDNLMIHNSCDAIFASAYEGVDYISQKVEIIDSVKKVFNENE
jgi:nucleoside 2-deoxyribosyltransferase